MNYTVKTDGENPIPYKRTTQRQKFKDREYQKYVRWKNKIYDEFIKTFKRYPHQVFKPKKKYYVDLTVYYKDKVHGDTDNVFKGVLDAVFQKPLNDKYICGSMDYFYDKDNPRVEIIFKEEA
jgi:Holliday junction resolvase RusA-like endonuclease